MIITAFDGSPRKNGNSSLLLKSFTGKAAGSGADIKIYKTDKLDLKQCRGCLICNTINRCSLKNDCWPELSKRILDSDVLLFSTPVYFHHATSSMKRLLDRFRSFIHVQITEDGLIHTPYAEWNKTIILITSQGSPDVGEAEPLNSLFNFVAETMGEGNRLMIINALKLAVGGQLNYSISELESLYAKLKINKESAEKDFIRNRSYITKLEGIAEMLCKG